MTSPSTPVTRSLIGKAIGLVVVLAIAFLWPKVESSLGIGGDSQTTVDQSADSSPAQQTSTDVEVATLPVILAGSDLLEQDVANSDDDLLAQGTAAPTKPAATPKKSDSTTKTKPSDSDTTTESKPVEKPKAPTLGKLRDLGNKRYASTAGLLYTPGSAEGHRLQHVMRHAKDDPERPIHGVFDGGYAQILAVIDEAYLKAQAGGRGVRTEKDRGRVVHTVDLGKRIGYIGGQAGKRQNKPAVNHLRLVLEGNRVITCFPLRP